MIKKRLLKLADRLERIAAKPPKKRAFNLFHWFIKGTNCGTQCCAVGEAGMIPEFRELGLKVTGNPRFKNAEGWQAVVNFFGLNSFAEAYYLFSSYEYPRAFMAPHTGPDEVAERIREFVASGGVIKNCKASYFGMAA